MTGLYVLLVCVFITNFGIISCINLNYCGENEIDFEESTATCTTKDCIQKLQNKCSNGTNYYRPDCVCAEGYLRAYNGTCIPENQCPTLKCTENEYENYCANSYCKHLECKQRGNPVVCSSVDYCVPGCSCIDGYLRADDGKCIPEDSCPPLQVPAAK